MLTLIQQFVRIGAQPNPDQSLADLLSGRNLEANQAMASLFAGATAEMPEEYRARIASIGRDIASYAMKNPVSSTAERISIDRSLQARKDLNAMGLRYYDESQFLDAVKRNDQLAVELFVAGRGVNLDARTWNGRSALDIARDNGNTQLADLLSRSLPAKR
jgi:ankyrin repeat protein